MQAKGKDWEACFRVDYIVAGKQRAFDRGATARFVNTDRLRQRSGCPIGSGDADGRSALQATRCRLSRETKRRFDPRRQGIGAESGKRCWRRRLVLHALA